MIMVTPCVPVSAGRMPEKREHPASKDRRDAGQEKSGIFREVFLQEYARVSTAPETEVSCGEGAGVTPDLEWDLQEETEM